MPITRTPPAVRTEHLTKQYDEKTAVDDLDLTVDEGSITCLLGPNGSGKTTTVAMLTTLRSPTSGTADVCGYDIVDQASHVRSVVGVTLQHTGVDDLMTGTELLSLQATLQGLDRMAARHRLDELVDLLSLGSHIDTRLGTWSGGLRRRIDLAAALVHSPRLLFLDEPTTGLDPASRRALWDEIRRLNKEEGVTVFLTTQYLEEAEALADTVSIINHGRLVITASPNDLKEGLGERTLVLDLADPTTAARAQEVVGGRREPEDPSMLRIVIDRNGAPRYLAEVTRAGIDVAGLTISEPSLEDVFLSLTDVA